MNDEWMIELPPLPRRERWIPVEPRLDIYQRAEMDINNPLAEDLLNEAYGEIPDDFDEFMQGFN